MSLPEAASFDVGGTRIAARTGGDPAAPALLLIHGFPSSSRMFRGVFEELAQVARVVAPDLPGFGGSDPIDAPGFARYADLVEDLLDQLRIEFFHLYLHDYGAAVGLHLATRRPDRIRGLIVQNANAHESGMGSQWADTIRYWNDPSPENERKATRHLTYEGTRDQYVGGIPPELERRVDPSCWEEDWRLMSLPGRLDLQRALVRDYRNHVARFPEIARYLEARQPPALMLWGRHDIFFDIDETLSWMKALPRMEAHILDAPHFLLETHARLAGGLIRKFINSSV